MNPEKQKHILLVVRHPVGGIRTYIKYIYSKPQFNKYRFTVILAMNDQLDLFLSTIKNISDKHIICEANAKSIILAVYQVLKNRDVDLVHSHGYTSGVFTSLSAKYFKVPHIMTAHDVLMNKQFLGIKGYIKKLLIPYILNRIDKIHAVSHDLGINIKEILPGIKQDKIVVITNGIDIDQFDNDIKRDYRRELGIPENHMIVGFLGRFMSQKGFKYLIEAMEILYNKEKITRDIAIVAIGSEGFIREEKEIIRLKGLGGRFHFSPPVDNISASLKGFDVIAIPSLWEACPLVPMEALIAGVPIIASNCIGLREVIKDSPAFVIEPANATSLAEMLKECLTERRADEFLAYIPTAKRRFDSTHTAENLLALYNNLILDE